MKRFLAVLAAFALSACATLHHPAPKPVTGYTPESAASITALRDGAGSIHCTVFSISAEEHLWMTARHCVVDDDGRVLPVYIGYELATVYKLFGDMDVAIVKTVYAEAPALHLADKAPELRDPIYVLGHGYGFEHQTLFQGRVANLEVDADTGQYYALFDMAVFPGHSGSPVMRPDNAVISVMQIKIGLASGGCRWIDLVRETAMYWSK